MASPQRKTHVRWWDPERGTRPGQALVDTAKHCEKQDEHRRTDRYMEQLATYLNSPVSDMGLRLNNRLAEAERVKLNLAKSIVDTYIAKLTANMPRTRVLTDGGDWGQQQSAQSLERFVEGVKARNGWRRVFPQAVRDAAILDPGIVKVWSEVRDIETLDDGFRRERPVLKPNAAPRGERVGRIYVERRFPWEIFVDAQEALYGKPRSWFEKKLVDRRVAAAMYPDHADAILKDAKPPSKKDPHHDGIADQVVVWEGLHLPSMPGADDGVRLIAIDGLSDPVVAPIPYRSTEPPYVFLHYTEPMAGVWGQSLVEEVRGIHAEMQDMAVRQQSQVAQLTPKIIARGKDAVANSEKITNDLGIDILSFPNAEPSDLEVWNPPVLNEGVMAYLGWLSQTGYEMTGISQLSARSAKPAGVTAQVALRELQDIETERFKPQGTGIEDFDLAVSKRIVEQAQRLHGMGVRVEVTARRTRRRTHVIERIEWADIGLDEQSYELQVYPASQLPRNPAGRFAYIEQLIAAGFVTKEEALRLLNFPDVEGVMSEKLAPINLVLDIHDELRRGNLIEPIPEMNLEMARSMTQMAILRATIDRAPESYLAALRGFNVQIDQLLERAEQAAAERAAAMNPGQAFVPQAAGALQPGLPQNAAPQGQAVIG